MKDEQRQRQFRDYYDRSDYFEGFADHYGTKDSSFNVYARKYIFSIYYPREGEKIVDLGCGWGNISLTLMRDGFNVVGVDYSVKSVGLCRNSAAEMGLDPGKFLCADVADLPFDGGSFDVVFTAGLVEHLFPNIFKRFLYEAFRVLRPEGRLVIGTPNPGHLLELLKRHNIILKSDVSHVDYKTMPGLTKTIADTGFIIEKAYYYPSHLRFLSAIEKLTQSFLPFMRRRICIRAIKPRT